MLFEGGQLTSCVLLDSVSAVRSGLACARLAVASTDFCGDVDQLGRPVLLFFLLPAVPPALPLAQELYTMVASSKLAPTTRLLIAVPAV